MMWVFAQYFCIYKHSPVFTTLTNSKSIKFQVYKFENTKVKDKCIFVREDGIFELVQFEKILFAAAKTFDVGKTETAFNKMLDEAVADYETFNANVLKNPTKLKNDILSNFIDLFELIIDIKKKESIEAAQAAEPSVSAVSVPENELASKRSKRY